MDTSKAVMSKLLDCSHEVLHNILSFSDPADLGSLSRSCRSLNAFIQGNKVLCRELYLQRFDNPDNTKEPDWEHELRALVKLERMLSSSDEEYKRSSLPFAVDAIRSLVSAPTPSKNTAFLVSQFKSRSNVDTLLTASSLFEHAGTHQQRPAATSELRQLAAKLHVYYGIPVDQEHASPPLLSSQVTTGPSYQVTHTQSIHHPLGTNIDGDGHYLRSKTRVITPANFVARAKVYDLREYTMKSLWGPFKGDGSLEVDWEKMEAIMVLMGHNLRLCTRLVRPRHALWYGPWEGLSPGSFPSRHEERAARLKLGLAEEMDHNDDRTEEEQHKDKEQAELDEEDPYGITGTWLRVVCFLDYNDLYAFNFTNERRNGDRQHGIATDEAIRLICLKLKTTRIVYPKKKGQVAEDSDSSSDYDGDNIEALPTDRPPVSGFRDHEGTDSRSDAPQDSPLHPQKIDTDEASNPYSDRPIVYFTGTSRSLHASWDPNANSRIRGVVRTTRHGDIRWTTWSIFHGEERWRSEGVQVGGPKSRRGVLGNWFDKDYDHYGPAGPTAFWKVSNDVNFADRSSDPDQSTSVARARIDLLRFLWREAPDSDDEGEYLDDNDNEDDDDNEDGGEDGDGSDNDSDDGNVRNDNLGIYHGTQEDLERDDDEDTQVSVEIIDERFEGVEFEIIEEGQELLEELEELRREEELPRGER
ncbi:hypothetical protein K461DRAFT_274017 [Myriangium duriaei CBS 260.36]|uniref:F-box domain-containing protein n=1 Tax=Myriangium duriaei CBS 260.36 TaxID=1168546 RepID=A0A9P4JCV6_9PEZI|nr:hypothetical protein K461DRAFT_274017 [Myriangium duriaei CBS 260.36]